MDAATMTQRRRPVERLDAPSALRRCSERWRAAGMSVGLVPTMGALHAGHVALLRRARRECDRVAVSIFVNPAQFGPDEDLDRYPRPVDQDLAVCASEGVDAVLLPAPGAVYPPGFATAVRVRGSLGERLEGRARPGHLEGVALVVAKLLVAARADAAYFGQKDAQQCALVRRLAADLDVGTRIVVCPTVRDADGLALSSRNAYLTGSERAQARAIPGALAAVARLVEAGVTDVAAGVAGARGELARSPGLVVEYVEVVDEGTFETAAALGPGTRLVIAARIGRTRLIDNVGLGMEAAALLREQGAAAPAAGRAGAGED